MKTDARTTRSRIPGGARAGRAFTLIELLVSILVIAILVGILIVAVRQVLVTAKRAGEQQQVAGMQGGIGVFQQTFDNRLPPLVYDGQPLDLPSNSDIPRLTGGLTSGPVVNQGANMPELVATYDKIFQDGGASFLNGRALPSSGGEPGAMFWDPLQDPRYSKFALPIFLTGVLGEEADGVSGAGMRLSYSTRQGWVFGEGAAQRASMYQPARDSAISVAYVSVDEYQEHGKAAGGVLPAGATDLNPDSSAFVNAEGVAIRYYRWEPFNPSDVPQGVDKGPLGYLNIPLILRDPRDWNAPNEPGLKIKENLRSARYAIVSAGPNGVFGTEPVALLRSRLGLGAGTADDQVRYKAWEDNVVVLGGGER